MSGAAAAAIRPARAEDADALAALEARGWRAAYAGYVDPGELDRVIPERPRRWRERFAGGGEGTTTLVLAGPGNQVEGFAVVGPTRDEDLPTDTGELHSIYVEPELTGHGRGAELLAAAEAELARAFDEATLWVLEPNEGARRFYERHGWRLDDRPFDRDRWGWAPSLRLRKVLRAERPPGVLVAVTDHAAERFRQRVGGRRGELDVRPEIASRVAEAWAANRIEPADRGSVRVRDLLDRDVAYVCRHDAPRGELVVVTLWEGERLGPARAPRRYTDALKRDDERRRD